MNWTGERVVIVGAARQGLALARYLAEQGARVTLNDQRPAEQLIAARDSLADLPVEWVCGEHPFSLLDGAGWLCPSGGVPLSLPLVVEALRRGIRLTNDSQIFLEKAPCPVIGITGSAGKTTTTTLVGRMVLAGLAASPERKGWVGGNIGNPLISEVEQMGPDDLAVMELSSFQLEIMSRSPQVAAVLNITPNHLDRHGTMEAYAAAKAHILSHQRPQDVVVLGLEDPGAWGMRSLAAGQVWTFGLRRDSAYPGTFLRGETLCLWNGQEEIELMPRSLIQLRGEHNLLSVLAACAIAAAAGIAPEAMRQAVDGFGGVPHRLEFVGRRGGAAWYNDSIATAPERAMAALRSFSEPIVLLAGGRDKNLPWEDFGALVRQRVRALVVFGDAAEKIAAAVLTEMPAPAAEAGPVSTARMAQTLQVVQRCTGLRQAVQAAAALVQPGDVVLLSPGGTSFDEFRDFEARGEAYRLWVSELS